MTASLPTQPGLLRPLAACDEALYCALYGSAEAMAHIGAPQDAATAARGFRAALRMNAQRPLRRGFWVILDADGAQPVGLAGLTLDEDRGAEVGVVLPPAAQGQGHATRAIRALAELAFTALGCTRLHTRHPADHAAAAALMQSLAFERLGADEPGPWRWQRRLGHGAASSRRQDRADPLRSAGLSDHGRGES